MASSLHATAVAIGGGALLICGPSRAGKSRLALALIARATRALPIVLVGDDRILLHDDGRRLFARPHPRIAGFIERRGLGIVAMDWLAVAPVVGVVRLLPEAFRAAGEGPSHRAGRNLEGTDGRQFIPVLRLTALGDAAAGADRVLAWWPPARQTHHTRRVSTLPGNAWAQNIRIGNRSTI